MKLSVLIPVYNEVHTLKKIINKVEAVDLGSTEKEIILIDDHSTDGSRELIRSLKGDYIKIFQDENKGKGAALKRGVEIATGNFIIFQDADLEYDPEDYKVLIEPVIQRQADIVYGSRFETQRFVLFGKNKTIHPTHWFGNKLLKIVFNLLYGTKLSDAEPCYKLIRSDILKSFEIDADGFEYDIELMCKIARNGHSVIQLPIKYIPRTFEEGKKITWKDGIIAITTMLKFKWAGSGKNDIKTEGSRSKDA